jgi:hypothetical protein
MTTERVWAKIAPGRLKYVPRSEAEAEGWEFDRPADDRPVDEFMPASNTYRLSADEKKRVFEQTGVHVEDYAHMKRVYRERGWRDVEKGEVGDVMRREIIEWARGGSKGPCPAGRNSLDDPGFKSGPPNMEAYKADLKRRGII